jgi:mannose/fructose-specific phosphotransferase system component IIA
MSAPVTGIVVVTHGDAGVAMVGEVERLLGATAIESLRAVSVQHGEPRDDVMGRLRNALGGVGGNGALVLVDLAGSTPCNCAVQLKRGGANIEVLCGLNLPMLIKAASADRTTLAPAALAHVAAETAVKSVKLGEGGVP